MSIFLIFNELVIFIVIIKFHGVSSNIMKSCIYVHDCIRCMITESLWQENKDEILSRLCKSFIERKKFKKYTFSQDSHIQIIRFKEKINELLLENNKPPIEDYSKEYFYIEDDRDLKLYVNTKENIWIKRKDNKLLDLSEVSIIINESSISNKSECTKRVYISPEIFNLRFGLEVDLIEKLGTW